MYGGREGGSCGYSSSFSFDRRGGGGFREEEEDEERKKKMRRGEVERCAFDIASKRFTCRVKDI